MYKRLWQDPRGTLKVSGFQRMLFPWLQNIQTTISRWEIHQSIMWLHKWERRITWQPVRLNARTGNPNALGLFPAQSLRSSDLISKVIWSSVPTIGNTWEESQHYFPDTVFKGIKRNTFKLQSPTKLESSLAFWAELSLGVKHFFPLTIHQLLSGMTSFHSMEKAKILKLYWKELLPKTLPSETKWGKNWVTVKSHTLMLSL